MMMSPGLVRESYWTYCVDSIYAQRATREPLSITWRSGCSFVLWYSFYLMRRHNIVMWCCWSSVTVLWDGSYHAVFEYISALPIYGGCFVWCDGWLVSGSFILLGAGSCVWFCLRSLTILKRFGVVLLWCVLGDSNVAYFWLTSRLLKAVFVKFMVFIVCKYKVIRFQSGKDQ